MKRIQAKKHKIGTYETDKISLSCFDDKRLYQMMEFILQLIFIKIVIKSVIRMKMKMKIIIIIIIMKNNNNNDNDNENEDENENENETKQYRY